ncbi:hypothetical protein J3R83DRAFT_12683, partial [Lanmaoa asiatica]
ESPADSGLYSVDQRRLKLLGTGSLSHPRGGLAFLSACKTATSDRKLSDEAIQSSIG